MRLVFALIFLAVSAFAQIHPSLPTPGTLEVFDAISVHPYRQGAPESVAEEYRGLRLLIFCC